MSNLLDQFYKGVLGSLLKVLIYFGFILLVIGAFWIGVGYGFGSCFGKGSCSPVAQTALVIFPGVIIIGGYKLRSKMRQYQAARYHESVKSEVLSEISTHNMSPTEQHRQVVIDLLNQYPSLTLIDLETKSTISKDDLLTITRQLLQERVIKQTINPDKTAAFTLGSYQERS